VFRKTVIPIAYLPASAATLRWGARLTRRLGSDLTVLYTAGAAQQGPLHASLAAEKMSEWGVDPPSFGILREAEELLKAEGALMLDERRRVVERHAFKAVDRGLYEVHVRGPHGENVRFRLREGAVVSQILQEVDDPAYDLICIGTRGRRGFRRHLLGSIAQDVAMHAPCSVLVAKHLDQIERVLVGVTGRESSREAPRQAAQLSRALDLPLELIAIFSDPEGREAAARHLAAGMELAHDLGIEATPRLEGGEPAKVLIHGALEGTLLALGRTPMSMVQKFFLGDISLKILDQGRCSVLIAVPPRRAPGDRG